MSRTKPCTRCGGTGHELDWRAIGAEVRRNREHMRVSLRDMAARVGCSPAYLSDLEHGRRGGGLRGEKTRRILKAVGVDPGEREPSGESRP